MYIHVRVITRAKEETLIRIKDAHFEARVKPKAERNQANRRLIELVAEHFGVPARSVRIVSGHHSPSKLLSMPD